MREPEFKLLQSLVLLLSIAANIRKGKINYKFTLCAVIYAVKSRRDPDFPSDFVRLFVFFVGQHMLFSSPVCNLAVQ